MSDSQARIDAANAALLTMLSQISRSEDGAGRYERALREFGSPGAFVEASANGLSRAGLTNVEAEIINAIPGIVRNIQRRRLGAYPALTTLMKTRKFLSMCYVGYSIERFNLLSLDSYGKLLDFTLLQSGNENSAPFYMKNILSEIVATDAKFAVMSHNHPGNTLSPSKIDIECTKLLIEAMKALGVTLLDHIVVAGKTGVSMRGTRAITEDIWLSQAPNNPINVHWLEGYVEP